MIQFDEYFSNGLKPPTSFVYGLHHGDSSPFFHHHLGEYVWGHFFQAFGEVPGEIPKTYNHDPIFTSKGEAKAASWLWYKGGPKK